KKLKAPLKGSKDWIEFSGTSTCRPFWGGSGNLDELTVDGPDGRIDAITLRMYSPTSRQWSLNWATKKGASFGVPTVGEFRNGRGEFYDQEAWEGRMILVRYIWSEITRNSAHFEQSFSDDGGKTWEVNWITDQTRGEGGPLRAIAGRSARGHEASRQGDSTAAATGDRCPALAGRGRTACRPCCRHDAGLELERSQVAAGSTRVLARCPLGPGQELLRGGAGSRRRATGCNAHNSACA